MNEHEDERPELGHFGFSSDTRKRVEIWTSAGRHLMTVYANGQDKPWYTTDITDEELEALVPLLWTMRDRVAKHPSYPTLPCVKLEVDVTYKPISVRFRNVAAFLTDNPERRFPL